MAFYEKVLTALSLVDFLVFHGIVIWAIYTGTRSWYFLWAVGWVVMLWFFIGVAFFADRMGTRPAPVAKS